VLKAVTPTEQNEQNQNDQEELHRFDTIASGPVRLPGEFPSLAGLLKMKTPEAAEVRIRRELAEMLIAEYAYWRNVEDELILNFAMGAMGGVSNVLAGLITGQDPAAYQKSIAARDGKLPEVAPAGARDRIERTRTR
jgi:hypothetical protein